MAQQRTTSLRSIPLDLDVKQEAVINGIEMGVLDNGIPYLTQNGLANVCGVQRLRIKEITDEWAQSVENGIFKKGRMTFIGTYLLNEGFTDEWICPYISRHLLSLNPLLARCRRYSRGER